MTDKRALLELVEKYRMFWQSNAGDMAEELAAILERPVVVGDEDVERARHAAMSIKHNKETWFPMTDRRLRAALESMVRGKS